MRSGGRTLNYRDHGHTQLKEFLHEIPGVGIAGVNASQSVVVTSKEVFEKFAAEVTEGLRRRVEDCLAKNLDTSELELSFAEPQDLPPQLLRALWKTFEAAEGHQIPVRKVLGAFRCNF